MNNRATPEKFMMSKHALALFRHVNNTKPSLEWCALHFNQILTSRESNFKSTKSNRLRVGLNALAIGYLSWMVRCPSIGLVGDLRHSRYNVRNCTLPETCIVCCVFHSANACLDMRSHDQKQQKTFKNDEKVPFSSCAREAYKENRRKKFVGQQLGVTIKSWLKLKQLWRKEITQDYLEQLHHSHALFMLRLYHAVFI